MLRGTVWRAPGYHVSRAGEERALRFIALMLFLQRLSYLLPAVTDAVRSGWMYRSPIGNAAMVAVAVAWNTGLVAVIRRRGWFPRWAVGVDVALVCVLLVAGTFNCPSSEVFDYLNWPSKLALASAALAGAALAPWCAVLVMLALTAAHLGATIARFGSVLVPPSSIVNVLNSYFWWILIAFVIRRYLCAQGRALDGATQRQLELQASRAAEQARYVERIRQYRRLHDTVLTTLTAIARGGLDHRVAAVRRRCAAEADYVRRLIREDAQGPVSALGARLGDVITEAEQLGLRVHYLHDRLPTELPGDVVDRIAGASREALNNVLAHSGTQEAWLTATGDEGRLLVRIIDQGRGFDPDRSAPGFGVRQSITGRMREAGGAATVSGKPGEGVCVDLRWPAG